MNGISFKKLKDPVVLIAVGFGSGLAPKAPGTAGTLLAIPLYLLMQPLPLISYLLITTCLFIAGIWICAYTAEKLGVHDHPSIVFDEIEGYLITTKNTVTKNQQMMHFGTFIDREGYFVDTVHFPPIASKFPFRGRGVYAITGKVLEEFDCITIEVVAMYKLAVIEDPRYADTPKTIAV